MSNKVVVSSKFMDDLEKAMIDMVYSYISVARPETTKEECRNLLAKIGTRIMFGADVYDSAQQRTINELA